MIGLIVPPNSGSTIVNAQAAKTISDSGRIQRARSLLSAKPSALTQAFAGTAATVAGAGALGFFLSKDLAPWMRPLSLVVFAACMGTIVWSLFGGTISPWLSLAIYGLSAALIVVDFNFLRKHGTENDAIWLATGIFVSIVNIFISLLNIFSSR